MEWKWSGGSAICGGFIAAPLSMAAAGRGLLFSRFDGWRSVRPCRQGLSPTLKLPEQSRQRHAECRRHFGDVLEAEVTLATLDRSHECPVDSALVGEGLLGEALLRP